MKFAILIATKNRHAALSRLLRDIKDSKVRPTQLVIVSSGEPPKPALWKDLVDCRVSHVHLEHGGQIAQKIVGIDMLHEDVDWVIFLDDDVRIDEELLGSFTREVKVLNSENGRSLGGIGFRTPATNRLSKKSFLFNLGARIFLLNSAHKGKVLISGHPTSYMESNKQINTEWLSGISAWKKSLLSQYGSSYPHASYAAMEDVFFSYKVSRNEKLLYLPTLKVDFQKEYMTNLETSKIYSLTSIWTYRLVRETPQLSLILFFYSQVGRSAYFVLHGEDSLHFCDKLRLVLKVNVSILINFIGNQDFNKLLSRIEKWN